MEHTCQLPNLRIAQPACHLRCAVQGLGGTDQQGGGACTATWAAAGGRRDLGAHACASGTAAVADRCCTDRACLPRPHLVLCLTPFTPLANSQLPPASRLAGPSCPCPRQRRPPRMARRTCCHQAQASWRAVGAGSWGGLGQARVQGAGWCRRRWGAVGWGGRGCGLQAVAGLVAAAELPLRFPSSPLHGLAGGMHPAPTSPVAAQVLRPSLGRFLSHQPATLGDIMGLEADVAGGSLGCHVRSWCGGQCMCLGYGIKSWLGTTCCDPRLPSSHPLSIAPLSPCLLPLAAAAPRVALSAPAQVSDDELMAELTAELDESTAAAAAAGAAPAGPNRSSRWQEQRAGPRRQAGSLRQLGPRRPQRPRPPWRPRRCCAVLRPRLDVPSSLRPARRRRRARNDSFHPCMLFHAL